MDKFSQAGELGRSIIADYLIEGGPGEPEASTVDMPEIAATEPLEREAEPGAVHVTPEPVEALSEPDLPAAEPVTDAYSLPDGALADLSARVAALEAKLAAPVPVESEAPPVEAIQPRRSPAHERAIRRAWAERKARREATELWHRHREARNAADDANAELQREAIRARKAADNLDSMNEALRGRLAVEMAKRRATAQRSRRMLASARQAATFQRQRADVLHAQLTEMQGRIVDPGAPERESDLMRLKAERDAALQRVAPLSAEIDRLKAVMVQNAGHIEALASRAVKAEVALRAAGLAPPLPVLSPVEGIAA